ncbi:hypothetical protein GCM10022384_49810 [Streptomyces marokkonensis]|uniref:Uncharacterized protein n=1 Tax=Streptomyces marokkonensis TaxID=324855 RepID=A0ABP7RF93_9ACTN
MTLVPTETSTVRSFPSTETYVILGMDGLAGHRRDQADAETGADQDLAGARFVTLAGHLSAAY